MNLEMLIKLLALLLFSYGITLFLVPFNIKFSRRFGLLDVPHQRGMHKKEIPLAGGISFAIPIIIIQLIFFWQYRFFGLDQSESIKILILTFCGLLMLYLGYLDDKKKFTAKYKLLFQIIIAIIMCISGFKIELLTNPFGTDLNPGIFSFPLTIIWFLLIINAFNLIDGLDGLASGISMIVALVLLAVGIKKNNIILIFLSTPLIGTNLAFLKYNFYPAKIFMGDTGSLFIGLNIAAITVIGTSQYKGIATTTMLIPISALIIPISDTILTVFRRIKGNKSIFHADKEHLHHKLFDLGFSQKTINLICYFITFLFGLIAFGFSFTTKEVLLGILLLLFLTVLVILIFIVYKQEN